MTRSLTLIALASVAITATPALAATTVTDPVGDFAPTYTGPHEADLDVTSFSVAYDAATQVFTLESTMAGAIDASLPGFYAIGVNTGTGPASFASIGLPGVKFNQVISVQKDETASIGGTPLAAGSVDVDGNMLKVMVPLSLLASTGFDPDQYGFNIWPRSGTALTTDVISDFAPDNATVSAVSAVPEPIGWAMMIGGVALAGGVMRRHRCSEEAFTANVRSISFQA